MAIITVDRYVSNLVVHQQIDEETMVTYNGAL